MTEPAAIYARYSTDRQDERSIEDQIRKCLAFAEAAGYRVVATHTDEAVSGTHANRSGLQALLAEASQRPRAFRAVIVDDLSRISRDIGDTHAIVFGALAGAGVKLVDTSGLDSEADSGEMTIAMRSIINREYVKGVSKQTHRGLTGRASQGFSTGGGLYGYKTVLEPNPPIADRPRKLFVIDEAEAAIVREVFAAYATGATSYRAVADDLNRRAILAPRDGKRGNKTGHGWGHTAIRSMLTNAKYVGTWSWNATKWTTMQSGKRTRRARAESERIVIQRPELAIIDRATWDAVQVRIAREHPTDKSGTRRGRPPGSGDRCYLVSGLLRCGTCGGSYSVCGQRTKAGVRYATFGCSTNRSRGESICDNAMTVSERKVTTALLDTLRTLLSADEMRSTFAAAFAKRAAELATLPEPAALECELKAAQKRVTNATRLLVENPDDPDVRRQREADRAEVARLTAAVEQRRGGSSIQAPDAPTVRASLDRFLAAIASDRPTEAREAVARALPGKLTLTPKTDNSGRVLMATGAVSLRGAALSNSSSGGRI